MNYKFLALSLFFTSSLINTTPTQQDRILFLEQVKEIITDQTKNMNTPKNPNDYKGLQAAIIAYNNSIMNPTKEHEIIFANIVATMYAQSNNPLLQIIRKTIESNSLINKLNTLIDNADWSASKEKYGITSTEAKNVLLRLIEDILDEQITNIQSEEIIENNFETENNYLAALDDLFEEYKTCHKQYMQIHAAEYSEKIRNLSIYQFHRLFFVHYVEGSEYNTPADDSKLNDIKYDITNLFFEFLPGPMMKDILNKMVERIDYEIEQVKGKN